MKNPLILFLAFTALPAFALEQTPELTINKTKQGNSIAVTLKGKEYVKAPAEGLWSIAQMQEGSAAFNWVSASPSQFTEEGPWKIMAGEIKTAEGVWKLRDACRSEENRIKCVRRFHWTGDAPVKNVVLSVRWQVNAPSASVFQPGLMYYGNPAAKANGPERIAHMSGKVGEFVLFEEHRFAMPFTSLEWEEKKKFRGAALHSIPSMVYGGAKKDQWWSMGAEHFAKFTELQLLSGPTGYNETRDIIKGFQRKSSPYQTPTLSLKPDEIIEKTFYLQAYDVEREGAGFSIPMYSSIDIFKPFDVEQFPTQQSIVEDKLRFLDKRWVETPDYAGFNMFDHVFRRELVMGWAGQSEAPGYALLALGKKMNRPIYIDRARKTLDFLATAPVSENGFPVAYLMDKKEWKEKTESISQGQALLMFARAIKTARAMANIDTSKWDVFFQKAADVHANRILKSDWKPRNTAEGFLVTPLTLGYELFKNTRYRDAALKAADHYGARHLSMREPYWGGTNDAIGEDKEGAFAGLQAFMAAYDLTKDEKYLHWAKHAADVTLSYTVVWNITMPAGRLADNALQTRGWTVVSAQNQHLDVYGVLIAPWIHQLGTYTNNDTLKRLAPLMYRSCGQLIDIYGSQGEQIQQTNFVQDTKLIKRAGENPDAANFRGGYSEDWTVLWITMHFLVAATMFDEMGVTL